MKPSAENQRGEGFAFFRWHTLRWQEPCDCRQREDYICVLIWRRRYGR